MGSIVHSKMNFNPRSHERSDYFPLCFIVRSGDFNPRSHERSDVSLLHFQSRPRDFNPRSHERSDTSTIFIYITIGYISIHAPTRGATSGKGVHAYYFLFQSTLPREERQYRWTPFPELTRFQSTLPREERPL